MGPRGAILSGIRWSRAWAWDTSLLVVECARRNPAGLLPSSLSPWPRATVVVVRAGMDTFPLGMDCLPDSEPNPLVCAPLARRSSAQNASTLRRKCSWPCHVACRHHGVPCAACGLLSWVCLGTGARLCASPPRLRKGVCLRRAGPPCPPAGSHLLGRQTSRRLCGSRTADDPHLLRRRTHPGPRPLLVVRLGSLPPPRPTLEQGKQAPTPPTQPVHRKEVETVETGEAEEEAEAAGFPWPAPGSPRFPASQLPPPAHRAAWPWRYQPHAEGQPCCSFGPGRPAR